MDDYCGARSRLSPSRAFDLDPARWAFQPKVDGMYCRLETDARGAVMTIRSRRVVSPFALERAAADAPTDLNVALASDLLGVVAGPPHAVLHGELEAHTEAGNRIAAARGWRALHLFDVTRSQGVSLRDVPYATRHAVLFDAHDAITRAGRGVIQPMMPDPTRFRFRGAWRVANPGKMVPGGPPRDLRRFPVVGLHADGAALWASHVEADNGEGLVAVRLDGLAGQRGAKRKVKSTRTIDCTVLAADERLVRLEWHGHTFHVGALKRLPTRPGMVVECAIDGWYELAGGDHRETATGRMLPRFARLVRARTDLMG